MRLVARNIALLLLMITITQRVLGQVTPATYDVSQGTFTCPDANGTPQPCPAGPGFKLGQLVLLTVCGAPSDLLTMTPEQHNSPDFELSKTLAQQIGAQGAASGKALRIISPDDDPAKASAALLKLPDAISKLSVVISNPAQWASYQRSRQVVEDAYTEISNHSSGITDPAVLANRLGTADNLGKMNLADKAALATYLRSVRAIVDASDHLGCFQPVGFQADVPFDVTLKWASANALLTAPTQPTTISVRFPTFRIMTTTGFAFSGLVDQHFTTKTVEVTPASGNTPAVTKKVAVEEARDALTPEATLFIHVVKTNREAWSFKPQSITFGGGISSGASGRIYIGTSWLLGNSAALSAGVAGGKIKQLSNNVDRQNLGNTDPEAARRDVFRVQWFAGISWRIGS